MASQCKNSIDLANKLEITWGNSANLAECKRFANYYYAFQVLVGQFTSQSPNPYPNTTNQLNEWIQSIDDLANLSTDTTKTQAQKRAQWENVVAQFSDAKTTLAFNVSTGQWELYMLNQDDHTYGGYNLGTFYPFNHQDSTPLPTTPGSSSIEPPTHNPLEVKGQLTVEKKAPFPH